MTWSCGGSAWVASCASSKGISTPPPPPPTRPPPLTLPPQPDIADDILALSDEKFEAKMTRVVQISRGVITVEKDPAVAPAADH